MAKGVKFLKRNRTIPGRADGSVVCTVSLPALQEPFDRRFQFREHDLKLTPLRRFVLKELSRAEALLEDGSVKVQARIRMPSGRLGLRTLGKWHFGESVESFLATIVGAWRGLEKEEGWSNAEVVDVPLARNSGKARVRGPAV